ncbi:MAG: hypothetical protein Q9207_002012 [Kuettlingeria erythrocarpa]
MGSPQGVEERGWESFDNDNTQAQRASHERRHPARDGLQATAPIEMIVMDDIPPAPASQNEQSPLDPSSMEATEESQAFQSTEDSQPETDFLPVAGLTSTPFREPLATTSANADPVPVVAEPHPLTLEKTGPTVGPLVDKSISNSQTSDAVGFSLLITLLLINGARHPFKIDEKYLKKRSVNADGGNPVNLSVYTLKELIWREWRDEWEPRPSSPSSIRLIFFGKLLEDKSKLHECRFDNASTPHVVHMTVKPQEIVDEEDAKIAKTGNRDRDGDERSPSCRCVIL